MRRAPACIYRFLLHVLPDGWHRIRHYGFLATEHRAAKIERCRKAIATLIAGAPMTLDPPRNGVAWHRQELRRRFADGASKDDLKTISC